MEKAKENINLGVIKTITAEEAKIKYSDTISFKEGKFFCSDCGENVTFVRRNKFKSFFMHSNTSEFTEHCNLRSHVKYYNSIYEKLGLPLYIKKTHTGQFELLINFYGLSEKIISELERNNSSLCVTKCNNPETRNKFYIDQSRFLPSQSVFQKISFISERYKLEYSSKETEKKLINKWGTNIEGFFESGAVFTFNINGGRKLRINDEISLEKEYLLVSNKINKINELKNIEVEEIGRLLVNTDDKVLYKIYKIKVKRMNDNNFKQAYECFRDLFKITLTYNPVELFPVWPPSMKKGDDNIFISAEESIFILKNIDEKTKVLTHEGDKTEKVNIGNIKNNLSLLKIKQGKKKKSLTINEQKSFYISINNFSCDIKGYKNQIELFDLKENKIDRGMYHKVPKNGKVELTSKSKCVILHLRQDKVFKSRKVKDKNKALISELKMGDNILLVTGIEKTSLLELKKLKVSEGESIFLNDIYKKIRHLNYPYTEFPLFTKKILATIPKTSNLYFLIKTYLNTNQIPIKAVGILKNYYINTILKKGI